MSWEPETPSSDDYEESSYRSADAEGQPPPLTSRSRLWFARWVRDLLFCEIPETSRELKAEITRWYYARATEEYLWWVPANAYRSGEPTGSMVPDKAKVLKDLVRARAECERLIEARRPPIPPGPINIDAALRALASGPQGTEEASAIALLKGNDAYKRWRLGYLAVRGRKVCRGCGDWFTAKPYTAESCAECRAARRLATSEKKRGVPHG